jgi:hypothetical protein
MCPIEHYQSMEAKFRREAESELDLIIRERLLTQADGWNWLIRASQFIAQKQAATKKLLAALHKKTRLAGGSRRSADAFAKVGLKHAE